MKATFIARRNISCKYKSSVYYKLVKLLLCVYTQAGWNLQTLVLNNYNLIYKQFLNNYNLIYKHLFLT